MEKSHIFYGRQLDWQSEHRNVPDSVSSVQPTAETSGDQTSNRDGKDKRSDEEDRGKSSKEWAKKVYRCPDCDKVLQHKSSLRRHVRTVHVSNFGACSICGDYYFTQRQSYLAHVMKSHKHRKQLYTEIEKRYSDVAALRSVNNTLTRATLVDFLSQKGDDISTIEKVKRSEQRKVNIKKLISKGKLEEFKQCLEVKKTGRKTSVSSLLNSSVSAILPKRATKTDPGKPQLPDSLAAIEIRSPSSIVSPGRLASPLLGREKAGRALRDGSRESKNHCGMPGGALPRASQLSALRAQRGRSLQWSLDDFAGRQTPFYGMGSGRSAGFDDIYGLPKLFEWNSEAGGVSRDRVSDYSNGQKIFGAEYLNCFKDGAM